MPTNADYTQEYLAIVGELEGDIESRIAARSYMNQSTAICHHEVVESSFIPRLYNQTTFDTFKHITTMTHQILSKIVNHYLEDPDYRQVFSFDKRLEELILLPRGYDTLLPFLRADVFLNEDTQEAMFCEFNGDGSSGMNENREITLAINSSESFKIFSERHTCEPCELFESWVDEFLAIYGTYIHCIEKPHIAICDFLENAVIDEFRVFAEIFASRGVECSIYDVRELSFEGGILYGSDGKRVDAIWRRCVTNDVMDNWEASQDLIEAVRAEKVALIGSFAGHLVHDKQIFQVLFDSETVRLLTADEITFIEKTVPFTAFLDDEHVNIDQIKANKDEWIIKPTDHYGAHDVYAGQQFDTAQWSELIDAYANEASGEPFLLQKYCSPFQTITLPPDEGVEINPEKYAESKGRLYNNLQGLYIYNGTFTGVFSRLGPLPVISKDMQGMTAATIWVDCDFS